MIQGIVFDLGNTLIEQVVDLQAPLNQLNTRLLPGARECLTALPRDLRVAVLSNTEQTTVDQLTVVFDRLALSHLGIRLFTSVTIGFRKPAPEAFLTVAEALHLQPTELVMVGNDLNEDIAGAQGVGMYTIYVGKLDDCRSVVPDLVIPDVGSISAAILNVVSLKPPRAAELERANGTQKCNQSNPAALSVDILLSQLNELRAEEGMQMAVALEQEQEWRRVGAAWLHCAKLVSEGVSEIHEEYSDVEATVHNFPYFDAAKWSKLSRLEKIGRAFRYAGYHFEGDGDRQSSYRFYALSGRAFEGGGNLDEASRSYFLALLSYARRFGEVDDNFMQRLEDTTERMVDRDREHYIARMLIYYRRLAAELRTSGNYHAFMKLRKRRLQAERLLLRRSRTMFQYAALSAWAFLTGDGQSLWRWFSTLLAFTIVLFPLAYRYLPCFSPPLSLLDAAAFSVGRVVPQELMLPGLTTVGRIVSVLQSSLTLLWVGVLVNIVSTRSQE